MRLLVFTQALDKNDPILSAYHRLVGEIAKNFDSVVAVCLKEGERDLPKNVKVLSLGKEKGESRWKYVSNFYRYIFGEKYDAVLVHMNQEYVLLGGLFWRLMGKKVYLWRNHHAGSLLTDAAAFLCSKVFCTSRFSYTAKYKKTVLMPVGIDTEFFKRDAQATRHASSILFLARIAPVKKPHVLVEALKLLDAKGVRFHADIVGDPLPADAKYYGALKDSASGLAEFGKVSFHPGIKNDQTPLAYSSHEVFVNLSSSGMYDKTIFEAMACESLVVATNRNLEGLIDPRFIAREDDADDIAAKIEGLLRLKAGESEAFGRELRRVADTKHSLKALGHKLAWEIS